jgi:hypothetical protein
MFITIKIVMNTLNSDILSNYPQLARSLRDISKEIEEKSLKGFCKLPITNDEIKNKIIPYYRTYKYGQRAIFTDVTKTRTDNYSALHTKIINKRLFRDDDDYIIENIYSIFNGNVVYIDNDYNNLLQESADISSFVIKNVGDGNPMYYDILTVRDLLRQRYNCLNTEPNYVNNKILDYFVETVNTFNVEEKQLDLHVYLTVNCMILNIDINSSRVPVRKFSKTYDEYVISIQPSIEDMYSKLVNTISTLQ